MQIAAATSLATLPIWADIVADDTRRRPGSLRAQLPDPSELREALSGFDRNVNLIIDLHREVREMITDTARLETQHEEFRRQMQQLFTIVRDSDDRSILGRLNRLEDTFRNLDTWKGDQKSELAEKRKRYWQLVVTLVSGALAIAAAAVALLKKG